MRPAFQRLTRVFGNVQFYGVILLPLTYRYCHGNEVWVQKVPEADIAEFASLDACVLNSETRDA